MKQRTALLEAAHLRAMPDHQTFDQLMVTRTRLERELASAFGAQPWPGALIERLADELTVNDRQIAALQVVLL